VPAVRGPRRYTAWWDLSPARAECAITAAAKRPHQAGNVHEARGYAREDFGDTELPHRRSSCLAMVDLIAVSLLAVDSLLVLILLHVEVNDPRRRRERVEARREALRRRESEAKKTGGDTSEPN